VRSQAIEWIKVSVGRNKILVRISQEKKDYNKPLEYFQSEDMIMPIKEKYSININMYLYMIKKYMTNLAIAIIVGTTLIVLHEFDVYPEHILAIGVLHAYANSKFCRWIIVISAVLLATALVQSGRWLERKAPSSRAHIGYGERRRGNRF
jgi:hypothetical protein